MTYNNTTTKRPVNLRELTKFALEVPKNGIVTFRIRKDEESKEGEENIIYFPFGLSRKSRGEFCRDRDTVSFIDHDGRFFVVPYFEGIIDCFQSDQENPIVEGDLWVPFSTGTTRPDKYDSRSKPAYIKWKKLLDITEKWAWEDVRKEIRERCPVGDVPRWILEEEHCFEIPPEGVKVKAFHHPKPYILRPIWYKRRLDETFDDVLPKLGTYNVHDGVLQINSNEGRSFVLKGFNDRFLKALRKVGYLNKNIFVAFSNKEEIIIEEE